MRNLRGDIVSLAIVFATAGALSAMFPFGALRFGAASASPVHQPFAAFVSLSADEESAAMKAAKSSWNADVGAVRRMRADMFTGALPEVDEEPVLEIGERLVRSAPAPVAPSLSPYLPSLAAPPPKAIAPDKDGAADGAEAAFTRDELLEIN